MYLNSIRFAPLGIEEATQDIINAILLEEAFITIPSSFKHGANFINFLPLRIQQLIRDHILKEYEFKSTK